MLITKYVKGGSAGIHDIHFTQKDKVCRIASNDEPRAQMSGSFRALCVHAAGLTGLEAVEIKKISFKRGQHKEVAVSIECEAVATNGDSMTIRLPEIGWRMITKKDPVSQNWHDEIRPVGIDVEFMENIQEFEVALIEYAKNGNGQLSLEFSEEAEAASKGEILEFAQK